MVSADFSISKVLASIVMLMALAGCSRSSSESAQIEGRVVVYSSTDTSFFGGIIKAFERENPKIKVEYHSLTSADVNGRYLAESKAGLPTADMLINSAMDVQVKLANDGRTRAYQPPQPSLLPVWARWNGHAHALSVEPIVVGYNNRIIDVASLGASRSDLAAFVRRNQNQLNGKIGIYDPEASSLGMLLINQDIRMDNENWDLVATLGRSKPKLYVSTREMIDDVVSGKLLIAYNVIGSYAFKRARQDPSFSVAIPQDYVLMMSRVAVLTKEARHPNAAAVLMDFLLSKGGQALISQNGMVPVRTDVKHPYPELARTSVKAVRVGPSLLANIDTMNRNRFLKKWKAAINPNDVVVRANAQDDER